MQHASRLLLGCLSVRPIQLKNAQTRNRRTLARGQERAGDGVVFIYAHCETHYKTCIVFK